MHLITRLLLCLAPVILVTDQARAEGLAQLTLHGAISSEGGARIELEWDHWSKNENRGTAMRYHLANSTTAFDVAVLLVAKLRADGAKVVFPAENSGTGSPEHAVQVFVQNTTRISFRLDGGIWAEVTLCDQGPELVQFFKPLLRRRGALIAVSTSTWQEHTKKPGKTLLRVDADLLASTSSICEQLFSQGLSEGLVCDRPSADSWRPIRSSGGAVITGCSISLISEDSDWGLEVSLSLPEKE